MHVSAQRGHPTLNAAHRRDAFGAPPGAPPFHRSLEARRLEGRGHDTFELAQVRRVEEGTKAQEPQRSACSTREPLLPKLGDVTPIPASSSTRVEETRVRPRVVGATGRVLDLYA